MKIRIFDTMRLAEAMAFAKESPENFALHKHSSLGPNPPSCFRRDVREGKYIGHLFCTDPVALERAARELGVQVVRIHRKGTDSQHIDLCGNPMSKALALAQWEGCGT